MTIRSTQRATSHRAYLGASRTTIKKTHDDKLMQALDVTLHKGETKTEMECAQNYGFTSHIKAEEQQEGGQGGAGSSGSQTANKAAEAITIFMNGNRSHGVAVVVDDRRYRLQKIKEGEVAMFDDQKQQVHLTRDGVVVSVPKGKKIKMQIIKDDDQQDQQQQQSSQQQQGSKKKYGTEAQAEKKVHASYEMTNDHFKVFHPENIEHHITDADGQSKHHIKMSKDGKIDLKFTELKGAFDKFGVTAGDVQWDQGSEGTS